MRRFLFCIMLPAILTGCKLVEYHPYCAKVGYKDMNAAGIARIGAICEGRDTVRFVMMGDTQMSLDETNDMVGSINRRPDIDFVIHGGDITEFGAGREFVWMHKVLTKLDAPYVALIGNHDVLGTGVHTFRSMYGPLNYSFVAGNVKFICLNTNALEFEYTEPVPDMGFLLGQLDEGGRYTKTVVAMHAAPYQDQFNDNVARIFQCIIKKFPGLQFCLHAHLHELVEGNDIFGDGVLYFGCDSMKGRSYLVFTIMPDGYSYEVVYF